MTKIEISMKDPPSNTTMTVGEIFKNPRNGTGPEVSDVNVSGSRMAICPLANGAYVYAFHVEGDGGKFRLEATAATPAQKPVDTSLGFSGWTYEFTVP